MTNIPPGLIPTQPEAALTSAQATARWTSVVKLLRQITQRLNQAVIYGAQSAPGGGTIIASGITTGTFSATGAVSFGGGISSTSVTSSGVVNCNGLISTPSGVTSAGGLNTGQNTMHFFTGTGDPGGAAAEGDVWFDG